MGGFPTRSVYWQPRFGLAYDVFGNGKTVIRGGWGMYYFHSGQFTPVRRCGRSETITQQ
jgi:hypothetical protein